MVLPEPCRNALRKQIKDYPYILVRHKVSRSSPAVADAFDGRNNILVLVLGYCGGIHAVGKLPYHNTNLAELFLNEFRVRLRQIPYRMHAVVGEFC